MRIHDISVPISKSLPVWLGDPQPVVRQLQTIREGDSSNVSLIQMSVHTGTHIDAPRHFLESGKTIDNIPLDKLIGQTLVIKLPDSVDSISKDILESYHNISMLKKTKKVLFRTRNSSLWHQYKNAFQKNFVGIDASGASFLAGLNLDLIGVDYLSVAPYSDSTRPHRILLAKEIVLLEGIDLTDIPEGLFTLYCLPILIEGCEGSPARAILVE